MAKILLDYAFPISIVTGTPAASTGFLKRVCVVVKPKAGQEGNLGKIYSCTNMDDVLARTDNDEAEQLFNAGMSQVYLLLMNDLDLATAMAENANLFFTVLISSDFTDSDIGGKEAALTQGDLTFTAVEKGVHGISVEFLDSVVAGNEAVTVTFDSVWKSHKISVAMEGGVSTAQQIATALEASEDAMALITVAIAEGKEATAQAAFAEENLAGGNDPLNVGAFDGVVGVSSTDQDFAEAQAVIEKRSSFLTSVANKAQNMFYAFGSLLANASNWLNQQYIAMPLSDSIDELGDANLLFDARVSFVITDDEFGDRLGFFAAGGKAIIAPYIIKNLCINLQSRALSWISLNQPQYTVKAASLLESTLQEDVVKKQFIDRGWITDGTVNISLVEDNFVASGEIEVSEPRALWRVFNDLRAT